MQLVATAKWKLKCDFVVAGDDDNNDVDDNCCHERYGQ